MRFFEMTEAYDDVWRERYEPYKSVLEPKCPVCGMSSGMRIPPIHLRIKGTPLPDIMMPTEPVVKNHVKEAIESHGFTGIHYLQSEVDIRLDEPVEGKRDLYLDEKDKRSYFLYIPPERIQTGAPLDGLPLWSLDVTGRARLRPENNCVPVKQCQVCGHARYSTWDGGLLVDEGRWDGSDMFRLVEHYGFVVVTERVKVLFEAQRFSGIEFVPLEEMGDKFAKYRPPRPTG